MKRQFLLFSLLAIISITNFSFSQSSKANTLIDEGITLHDQGKYKQAIKKYDKCLKIEPKNTTAIYEKAVTYYAMGKYEQSIKMCRQCKKLDPDDKTLKELYVMEANCLDVLGRPDKAIKTYEKAIKKFPDYYLLYFNKGITEVQQNYMKECNESFKKAIELKPDHAGSYNALSIVTRIEGNKIPMIMMLSRYLIISPSGATAEKNLERLENATIGSAEKTGRNSTTISIGSLNTDSTAEDNFSSTEMIMAMSAGIMITGKSKKKNSVEKLAIVIGSMCTSLKENIEDNKGYYWERFAPYFIEMQEEEMVETFCYIANYGSSTRKIKKWIENNQRKIKKFYEWDEDYKWEK